MLNGRPYRLHRVLERSVADGGDHRALNPTGAVSQRDTDCSGNTPADAAAGGRVEGTRYAPRRHAL
jgi:hypothetical protein